MNCFCGAQGEVPATTDPTYGRVDHSECYRNKGNDEACESLPEPRPRGRDTSYYC